MSNLSTFGSTAQGLSRNPLGIIALFIVLIYGFAALTLVVNSKLGEVERVMLVIFLIIFPILVLILFGWLVSEHHEKLYAPGDFRSDEIFLKKAQAVEKRSLEINAYEQELKNKITDTVKEELSKNNSNPDKIAERVVQEVQEATTFTVDATEFLQQNDAIFTYPIAAFESLGDLTDEVYFKIASKVRPYQYGSSWVLKNKTTNEVIRTLRMLTGTPTGQPLPDIRTLREVGIQPGSTIIVKSPRN